MAGTLVISTLSDGTNSTSSTNCIQGSAKAWVNFNGSGGAIRASYNVSSITVNGTGDYTVNYTNAFSDANYAMAAMGGNTSGDLACVNQPHSTYPKSTTYSRIQVTYQNGTTYNANFICVTCFR